MDDTELQDLLMEALENTETPDPSMPNKIRWTRTFAELGVLTHNKGLVIRLKDGDEFQITIVKSKSGKPSHYEPTDEGEY